ncbi:major capsid protein [Flavobacterium phage vB_FspS_snusmum6-1]|uniref:Major capsid protein n=4 Tax=Caudoviricetes TaxID=2731619 RepID=A0A6B9LLF2_9CAUD|nr:major capsid protein [Flavobacterium phage vB_FspS_hattifnatt9-1]YP_009855338.1 major capsid protein [Flavobacterium phage vB_FspS_snusmum6-1]QHB40701.1 major capsid protein [Flavobacterium phage vB_FspS_snusmum6-2]QHB40774.1 major capsid protein [Flavobacterium phage vB_FspS_snusmum6-3]QHB40845.1 major capsid protein [Flavobacterium phage vB_FspS_snusmum9-1]QHB38744.1 major capsid protein [Flavobacterium phage vB_FspS_hattifnatt9-1]QHB40629.1 major capsid protein [Flavobacterium phage vB_
MEEIIKELGTKIDAMKNESVSKAELIEVMSKIADLQAKGNDVDSLKANIEEVAIKVLDLETKGVANNVPENLASLLAEKADELKAMKEKSGASVQITLKAAGTMALSTNVTGQVPQAERESGITRIVKRNPFILQLVNVGTIMSNVWEWVEQKNLDGGSAMTAEGAAKSQADFDLVVASANVKKVTAYIKVTKEMLDDVELMRSEIDQELTELINLKIDDQLLNGSGLTVNLTGITTNATAWAAGSFANAIPSPTKWDVLRTAINQVRVNLFEPNYIVMHPSDVTAMELSKDSTGQYVMPPFAALDGTIVSGIRVVANTGVTIDKFLVGDFSKSGVRFKEGLTINVGYENDDFTKNLVTILAEARLVHRVKSNHYGAFVYGDFSDAISALTPA